MCLKSCCALFLLALVACQAAPSIEKNSISEAETFANTNINLEDTGAEKDRAKKSTTFCVEVRDGKSEQIPCRSEPQEIVQPEVSKPVFFVQPVPVPAPVPAPAPAPVQAPAPAAPIINIVSPGPVPEPCDKPTIVHTSPQLHTVLIHPPSQPTPPVINQEAKPHKEETKLPKVPLPRPQRPAFVLQRPPQKLVLMQRPECRVCKAPVPVPSHLEFIVRPQSFVDVSSQYGCKTEKEAYECNCQSRNNARSSHISSQFNIQDPNMIYPNSEIDTVGPYKTVMMTRGNNPSAMSNQLMFLDSEEAREAEGRHHKKHNYAPINVNMQFPAYASDNVHKYYQSQYYTNPISYTNPNSNTYGAYGNYAGTSYPINYDFQASANNVPTVTVNAGGPFYGRESHHTDDLSTQSNKEMLPEEALSTATEMINAFNNSKRETDINQ